MYCNNIKNIIGAARRLTEVHEWVIKNKETITQEGLSDPAEWHLIPPNAPHMCEL